MQALLDCFGADGAGEGKDDYAALTDYLVRSEDRYLFVIDQFEEIFAKSDQNPSQIDQLFEFLLEIRIELKSKIALIVIMRSDQLSRLLEFAPQWSTAIENNIVLVGSIAESDMRKAIEEPARFAGLAVEPGLTDLILNDAKRAAGALALVQYVLRELWERSQKGYLTVEAYHAIGGVTGSVEKIAESLYATLTPAQQDAARRLFLRLVIPGEGQEDTRARSIIPDDSLQRDVISLFAEARLLVMFGSGVRPTVEVAHEALIQRWPRLREWVNSNREKLRARATILRAMTEWEDGGKSNEFLLGPGIQLERGRALVEDPYDVPVDDIRDYVIRSIELEDHRLTAVREAELTNQKLIAEAERKARQAAEQKTHAEEQARKSAEKSARKLRARFIAATAAAALAIVGASVAAYESFRAAQQAQETQRQLARADMAVAQSINNDLGLEPNKPLTVRQRNALWKLAVADELVKESFVLTLERAPAEDLPHCPRACPSLTSPWPVTTHSGGGRKSGHCCDRRARSY